MQVNAWGADLGLVLRGLGPVKVSGSGLDKSHKRRVQCLQKLPSSIADAS